MALENNRHMIWNGVLEWTEKSKDPTNTQKLTKHVPCQVSTKSKDNEQGLKTDSWPQKLIMQLMPRRLIGSVGGGYLKNAKHILFHPTACEALEGLTKVMSTGFTGCVHFPHVHSPAACDIKILILLYAAQKKAFLGIIPSDQTAFIERLRKLIHHQKTTQAKMKQEQAKLRQIIAKDNKELSKKQIEENCVSNNYEIEEDPIRNDESIDEKDIKIETENAAIENDNSQTNSTLQQTDININLVTTNTCSLHQENHADTCPAPSHNLSVKKIYTNTNTRPKHNQLKRRLKRIAVKRRLANYETKQFISLQRKQNEILEIVSKTMLMAAKNEAAKLEIKREGLEIKRQKLEVQKEMNQKLIEVIKENGIRLPNIPICY